MAVLCIVCGIPMVLGGKRGQFGATNDIGLNELGTIILDLLQRKVICMVLQLRLPFKAKKQTPKLLRTGLTLLPGWLSLTM
ncbi:hypothetical protein D3C71_1581770 [compost metagenome]